MFKVNEMVVRLPKWSCSSQGWAYGSQPLLVVEYNEPSRAVKLKDPRTGKILPFTWDAPKFELFRGAVPAPAVEGRKDDSGKLDTTLLDDMPRAIAALTEVMQWAITKKAPTPYERGSWLGVHADRYRAANLRHNLDATRQAPPGKAACSPHAPRFQRDPETNLLHLAHQACSVMMALENTLRELEAQNATR